MHTCTYNCALFASVSAAYGAIEILFMCAFMYGCIYVLCMCAMCMHAWMRTRSLFADPTCMSWVSYLLRESDAWWITDCWMVSWRLDPRVVSGIRVFRVRPALVMNHRFIGTPRDSLACLCLGSARTLLDWWRTRDGTQRLSEPFTVMAFWISETTVTAFWGGL